MMTIEQIQRILREFGGRFEIPDSTALTIYRGFSGADVFRLRTAAGDMALRRWPKHALPAVRIRGLHRLLDWIAHAGVTQVAVPITSLSGTTLISIGAVCWQLEPWMQGAAEFRENPSRERLTASMRALADWHRAAATFIPRDSEREWFRCESRARSPAVRERLEKLHVWMSGRIHRLEQVVAAEPENEFRDLARQVVGTFHAHGARIANELRKLAAITYRLQPCLRDVWHDHILFTGDAVTGIIDPSACRLENVATDLARLLGSFVEDDAELWNFAVDAYSQHNPLFDAEWELMRTLDRSTVLLSGLFWTDRKYLRRSPFADEHAVLDRLRAIVGRQQALKD